MPGVRTAVQIGVRHRVAVIPARPGGPRRNLIPAPSARRHRRRPFFLRSVHLGGQEQPMEVNVLGDIRIVDGVDRHWHAFAHPQHRAGRRAVVPDCADDVIGCEFNGHGRDSQREVRLRGFRRGRRIRLHSWHLVLLCPKKLRGAQLQRASSRQFEKVPSLHESLKTAQIPAPSADWPRFPRPGGRIRGAFGKHTSICYALRAHQSIS